MKRMAVYLISFFFLLQIGHLSFADSTGAKFEPPPGKILLLIGQNNLTIEEYIEATKIVPGGFILYTNIHYMKGLDSPSADYGSGISYADELIQKYPNTVLQIGLYMVDALDATYLGEYDSNINDLANWLKKIRIPVYLRIGYEFDAPFNHYNPQDYQKAYRYLVDKLRASGVENVAYVWHAHSQSLRSPIKDWYPGDNYVDWVGISYFQQHENYIKPVIQFAKDHNKPLMAAEVTPQGTGTSLGEKSWKRWFKPFFSFVAKYDIKAISYINSNWEEQPMWQDQGWEDARIQANPCVKEHWLEEVQKDKYLQCSEDLFQKLGYNP